MDSNALRIYHISGVSNSRNHPKILHFLTIISNEGQYSPYFSVPSDVSPDIPRGCSITFAQVLSRHGARDPTSSKTVAYNATIQKIQSSVQKYSGKYAFLKDYEYTLGADRLTTFGEEQLMRSGIQFYRRYEALAHEVVPFVRSSGQDRVIESARCWNQGFSAAKVDDKLADDKLPSINVVVPEGPTFNNTLSIEKCPEFQTGTGSTIGIDAKREWAKVFALPIQKRLNTDLPGAELTLDEVIYVMDLCPFNVVASDNGEMSPFCDLFTEQEWHQYNYYQTLDKWYGHSSGNPLGPTQGVGFVNELIARMTDQPVQDETSTNHTLDDNPDTFPLGRKLYADFSHDNDMASIFSAVGLYNGTEHLPNTTVVEAEDANGYSAAWTVPFAARAYFEKMTCQGHKPELVRVVVNDRVMPLKQCGGDGLGRCTLKAFIDSLAFARNGGHWDRCFK
jgi:hypothetical protein